MTDEQFNQILKRLSDIERHMGTLTVYLSEDQLCEQCLEEENSSMDEAIARLEADADPTKPFDIERFRLPPKRPV